MGKLNEIYVAVKDIDYIVAKIGNLCDKYNNRHGVDYKQQRALFRNYCHDTIKVFDECFETSMLGMMRCKARVKVYQTIDTLEIDKATFDIINMLCELKAIVGTMIPIKDLPSCKKLIELSPEDLLSKAKDLIKGDIVKAGVGALLLGSKITDIIEIEDVRSYYNNKLDELNCEILEKGGTKSPIEQYLLDKFNAEVGYCNLALFKAGINISKELKDMVEIGKRHIEKFETQQQNSSVVCNRHFI